MSSAMTELIYIQLLELYAFDLEVELLAEKLKNKTPTQIQPKFPWEYPSPNPWNQPAPYYGPPYIVTCNTDDVLRYSEEYDSNYNVKTNEWTESTCGDPACEYCSNRPEKPLP